MPESETSTPLCKSVFESGESTTTEQDFTQVWIRLIHVLESAFISAGAEK